MTDQRDVLLTKQFWKTTNPNTVGTPSVDLSFAPTPVPDNWVIAPQGKLIPGYHTTETVFQEVATKFDDGKRDWSLLPYDSVEEIVKVLEFGAKKYARDNWKRGEGFKYSRTFNAIMRHMTAVMFRKEDKDPETGLSHWAHIGCNVLFILHFVLNKNKYDKCDDR